MPDRPDNRGMHVLIPYAASLSPGCRAALPKLQLPYLRQLLTRLSPQATDHGDALSWSPPHERALAHALGLAAADGQIPWAALRAREHPQLADTSGGWCFVTLCHWQSSMQDVAMRQIPMQDLTPAESDTLLAAMRPFFVEDGITLHPDLPGRWLAHGAVFETLASASPDRVQGCSLSPWMPSPAQAAGLLRLMGEMQMLLYTHALHDAREARGALPVNAIWFSGSGRLPASADQTQVPAVAPVVVPDLRAAALQEDWMRWVDAWHAVDASHGQALLAAQARGEPVQLTLCGDRHARHWSSQQRPLLQRLRARLQRPDLSATLEAL